MKEIEFFKIMHKQVSEEYPRFCSCGIIHTDEIDYNNRTIEVKGHSDCRQWGLGRMFHRNCPDPCGTTLTKVIAFDELTEDKFFDYVGNRKKREGKKASEIVQEFRQEYNSWLNSLPRPDRSLVLGVGCELIDNIFAPLNRKQIYYLNAQELIRKDPFEVKKAREIVHKNPGRIDLVAIQADLEKVEYHKRLVQEIKRQDGHLKRHTTILAIGSLSELKRGYKDLDLNGYIPNDVDLKRIRQITGLYLPYYEEN